MENIIFGLVMTFVVSSLITCGFIFVELIKMKKDCEEELRHIDSNIARLKGEILLQLEDERTN